MTRSQLTLRGAVPSDLFIGVVTYLGTRFPASAGPEGLAARLSEEFAKRGRSSRVEIYDQDAWTPDLLVIDEAAVRRSIDAELAAEARWRLWHSPRTPRAGMDAFMAARRFYRRRKFLPKGRPITLDHPGARMARRLVNIEVAHLTLLRQARYSGAAWALILEDDASGDPAQVADDLVALLDRVEDLDQPKYVNVSRSFTEGRLKVQGHLTDIGGLPKESSPTRILQASRPVTNTVCAVLYRGVFLPELVDALDAVPLDPVVPIDWKLNTALMDLSATNRLLDGDCWLLRPAPITQGSMHN